MTATTLTDTATKKPNTDDLPYLDVIKDSHSLHQHYQKIRLQTPLNTYSLLVESGLISAEQLQETLNDANRPKNQHIGFFLRKKNLISDEDLGHLLARSFSLPFVHLRNFDIEINAVQLIPVSFARKNTLIPIMLENKHLVVAVADPTNNQILENLQFITGKNIELAVAMQEDILLAIATYYSQQEMDSALKTIEVLQKNDNNQKEAAVNDHLLERPVVQLVQNLITEAVINRASDIHIRPHQNTVELFFRVDGMLVHQRSINKQLLPTIITRLKILGGMDISERRLPQDGRSRIRYDNKEIDLRLSVMPSIYGEDVVIRLLDTQFAMKHLEDLGYEGDDAERIRHLLSRNNGMFLITGPTGSGKSTTLYTVIEQIHNETINIITVEDPVEYHMDGITQIQINPQTNYTFARALKHILRHDPDVIMIGEIRDEETAKIAVESALTGHLVLSTLHTNSAATTITRFLEIGIEPYMLSSTLLGVLAQRLARSNCQKCLVEEVVDPSIRHVMGATPNEVFYKGAGCDACKQRGVKGRHAVYELLVMSPTIKAMVTPHTEAADIQKLAIEEGMTPLTAHALHLARKKVISLAEAYRVRLD
ncbi:MAG: type II/IV secretion system protein [Moraxellaceae bacterium]|nr:type II/IV secretion system protein [Moraxellaceae bacterium]